MKNCTRSNLALTRKTTHHFIFGFVAALLLAGCASVPKEMVELSYRTGEDMAALHESYDYLIHDYYSKMREQRSAYLDDIWFPRFLDNWVEGGELAAIAKGEKIWSEEDSRLILTPPGSDPQESLLTLRDWVDYALYAYEVKEDSLLISLTGAEAALRKDVKDAFNQVIRANAAVTAHLNSIREVKEIQDEALEALQIKDLRDRINTTLINVSGKAAEELERIRELDKRVDDLTKQINQ